MSELQKMVEEFNWPFTPHNMRKEDEGFVYGTWCDSLWRQSMFRKVKHQDFVKGQRKVIGCLLNKPGVEVMVASSPDKQNQLGWMCYEWKDEQFVLHYVYIRPMYQRCQVATALIKFAGCGLGSKPDSNKVIIATHWTKAINNCRKSWGLIFNPFMAWEALDASSAKRSIRSLPNKREPERLVAHAEHNTCA